MCRMQKIQKIWQSEWQAESRFQMLSFNDNDVVGGCWQPTYVRTNHFRPPEGDVPSEFSVENNNWLVPLGRNLSIPMYKNRN